MKGRNSRTLERLICVQAKSGGECDYHSVRLRDVEQEIIDRAEELIPPSVDADLDEEIEALRDELRELEDAISTLVDVVERAPSVALSKRLTTREAERDKVSAALEAAEARALECRSNVVQHRARRLQAALKALRADPKRKNRALLPAANAALRECLARIVVNYDTHQLHLHWRHGGNPTIIHYAVAELFGAPLAPQKTA
ncbi:MAG TPA: hypothetical protein VN750_14240 [Steroidobacteraceae bacterium]|nr:hypothetical protein [Steroidobacteraceae bacterium]